MYVDSKETLAPLTEDEVTFRASLDAELSSRIDAIGYGGPSLTTVMNNDKYYAAGIGIGIKQPKPFVIVDGVVYINASMIKECTL